MKSKYLLTLVFALFTWQFTVAKPRLVIQIVIGSMRAEDMTRYAKNFEENGLKKMLSEGCVFTNSRFDYQQTLTEVSLATITTGAMPSTHGVIGDGWIDYTSNRPVKLLTGGEQPTPSGLVAPTLGETLLQHSPRSRVVTIATRPLSAMVMNGRTGGEVYWLDENCQWASSTNYMSLLPKWVYKINREKYILSYISHSWRTHLDRGNYLNSRHWDITLAGKGLRKNRYMTGNTRLKFEKNYERLCYTPAGNTAIFGLAKQAVTHSLMGAGTSTDLLNICLDPAQNIMETYGPESIEAEDMIYRLDHDLADFLTYVFAQVKEREVVVVLTSAHGTSPSFDLSTKQQGRFNARQFEIIVNGFLNVRYGAGDWVIACENRSLWLNHNLIYERGLNLADVQNEVAIFAMQFSGISHALAASAMRNSYFGSGYAQKMQNSFYPRRSGDVLLNLMPGWIEEQNNKASLSGSMYGYDNHIPLIFYGKGIPQQRINREVNMTSIASTLAHLMEITEPAAAEGKPIPEIIGE